MEVTLHFCLPDLIAQLPYHINEQDSLPTELLNDISKNHTHGHTDTHFAFISIDMSAIQSLLFISWAIKKLSFILKFKTSL